MSDHEPGWFPADADRLDARWLTAAFHSCGVGRNAAIDSIDSILEIGTGQAARSFRFELSWIESESAVAPSSGDALPRSIVGKFPSIDPGARATLEATGGYWKEWYFYDELGATLDVRAPRCYAARIDPATSDFVILMEDIREALPGDQMDGLEPDQLELAVLQAAAMHGPRFGDEDLETLLCRGPGVSTLAEAGPFCEEMYQAVLPEFLERFGAALDPDALALVEQTAAYVARWFRGTSTPRTLVHQDLRADNLLFSPASEAASPIVVVDFQALTVGVGATDLAYLIGGSTADPDRRADVERDLLESYRRRMGEYGIDQSTDSLWDDYRHGSLWGVIMTVLSSIAAERTERGEAMFETMANRHARHAHELDALATLQ